MEKKFKILRIIGTVWKILAWIVLIVGVLVALGSLLMSIFGGSMLGWVLSQFGVAEQGATGAYGIVGGIVGGFILSLVLAILALIEFLMLYAIGDLIYLFLDIEANTRLTAQWVAQLAPQAYTPAPPVYTPPPPAYSTPLPPTYPTPVPGQ